jgi:hypothetical protein
MLPGKASERPPDRWSSAWPNPSDRTVGDIPAEAAVAGKPYTLRGTSDADKVIEKIIESGAKAVIPLKSNRKQQREFDRPV